MGSATTIYAAGATLYAALAALAAVDARSMRLPDTINLPLIAAGLIASWALGAPVLLHALAAMLGYAGLVAVEIGYQRLRGRPGIGRGDAKLFAAGGAWCGPFALPLILLAASVFALAFVCVATIVKRRRISRDAALAFGPFLAIAIGLTWTLKQAFPDAFALM